MSNNNQKQKKNQIIRKKWFLPEALTVLLGGPWLACVVYIGITRGPEALENPSKKAIVSFSITTAMMIGVIAIVIWCAVERYEYDYVFASRLVRNFIKQVMKDHPELKSFEKVLDNPQAMRNIATMVSNAIEPSVQSEIVEILRVWDESSQNKYFTHADDLAMTKKSCKKLSKIMEKYIKRTPRFIQDIYAAMSHAHNTYVLSAKEIVR